MKLTAALLGYFVTMPIWYYLLYQILLRVNATELMFFLFWVYVPVTIFASLLIKIAESKN